MEVDPLIPAITPVSPVLAQGMKSRFLSVMYSADWTPNPRMIGPSIHRSPHINVACQNSLLKKEKLNRATYRVAIVQTRPQNQEAIRLRLELEVGDAPDVQVIHQVLK